MAKHQCQSFFFIKKETLAQVFSREFCEISKNTCLREHPGAAKLVARNFIYKRDSGTDVFL